MLSNMLVMLLNAVWVLTRTTLLLSKHRIPLLPTHSYR
jgi:hypothetical protein